VADVADKSEQTALIKACTKNGAGLEMAQLLLAHKADLTPTDNKVRRKQFIHEKTDSKKHLRPCVMNIGDVGV
jgi:ankyrin repeat protein